MGASRRNGPAFCPGSHDTISNNYFYGPVRFWLTPGTAVILILPNVPSDPVVRADILIRVWDNQGGTITRWDQLYDAASGAVIGANASVPRGELLMFTELDQLGNGGLVLSPTLRGLQSFQLYLELVPEPSTWGLGVLGAGCLLLYRRRR